MKRDFTHLKPGDLTIRMLAGLIECQLIVRRVDDQFLYCADLSAPEDCEWQFRRDNGCEVDEDLGFDGVTITGSYLK